MKKAVIVVSVLVCAAAAFSQFDTPTSAKIVFAAPTAEAPRFTLRFSMEVTKTPVMFKSVDINGIKTDNIQIRRADKVVDLKRILIPGDYDIVIDFAWKSKTTYKVSLTYMPQGSSKEKTDVWTGTSPNQGGIPDSCREGFYRILTVEEDAGLERKGEVASTTLTTPKSEIEGLNLTVWDAGRLLPSQVLDTRESVPLGSQAVAYPVTLTNKLAFAIDSLPHQKKMIFVLASEQPPAADNAFTVTGDGPGKTIVSSRLKLQLHAQSGQIGIIEYVKEGLKLHNDKIGVIHGNPDVFVPGVGWDHSFDWNPPPSFTEKNGPVLYINARKGPMPHIKDIVLEVKYTLEKDAPYILSETMMTVGRDLGVVALRNDEMVFYRRLFDTLMYKDLQGGIVQRPLIELGDAPDGLAHIAPADVEWVGLVNTMNRYGFFGLRLASIAANLDAAGDFLHKPGTYFYAPADAEFVHWVRPLLYTWAETATKTHLTFLPQGSFFYEKNAYVLLPLSGTTPAALDEMKTRLLKPLRVY